MAEDREAVVIKRNASEAELKPVSMEGASGVSMAVMLGRGDGVPNFALRQFSVEPGGHTPRHSHDYEHEVYVIEGSGAFHFEGEDHGIGAGDVLYVPADSLHQFVASDEGLRFFCLVPVDRNCGEPTPGS